MSTIFISYANKNESFARLAEMMLEQAGYDVWLDDQKLRAGDEWRRAIDDGITASVAILVVITPDSCESKYVTYEWAFALGSGRKVIPLLVSNSDVHPRLAALQHLDFTNKKAMPWARLFHEIDIAEAGQDSQTASARVGDMTPEQLQTMIAGAVSLATATTKGVGKSAAPEDISRAARNVVDVMQHAKQKTGKITSTVRKQILWVDDRPDNNIYERDAFEAMGVQFTLALSTNEALGILEKEQFAAIISDMGRQEGPREGYVLLDNLRRNGDETPFFIYASSNAPKHKHEAAQHGAQGSTNHPQELFELVMGSIDR